MAKGKDNFTVISIGLNGGDPFEMPAEEIKNRYPYRGSIDQSPENGTRNEILNFEESKVQPKVRSFSKTLFHQNNFRGKAAEYILKVSGVNCNVYNGVNLPGGEPTFETFDKKEGKKKEYKGILGTIKYVLENK